MKEWSGAPHPDCPDGAWQDDETGEAVCAYCAERAPRLEEITHAQGCDRPAPHSH
jgi:hypothetical protein